MTCYMTLVLSRFNAWPLTESHHPDHAMATGIVRLTTLSQWSPTRAHMGHTWVWHALLGTPSNQATAWYTTVIANMDYTLPLR